MDLGALGRKIYKFADAQCLPVGLVVAICFGIIVPPIGVYASKGGILSRVCVIIIFGELSLPHQQALVKS